MHSPPGKLWTLAIFAGAAVMEVAGDALIRRGIRGGGLVFLGLGLALLGGYSVSVNLIDLDFSRVLGAYVGVFAIASVLIGRLVFHDQVPAWTWLGLAVIVSGSLIIQFGSGRQ